ncbi:MAG: excinuclease ABC subunit UvrA [Bacteroidales bacterium]|nr:excinuclease ABC subunit UvrA [Bacteroidales bacterium]
MKKIENITIQGARVNNLKNISLSIPKNKFVVITGLSGSGKSSLAFDTIYAEGQRRYVESLSAYARQFLGRMSKPDVDLITGLSPAIAIEQRVNSSNPRSTVGTSTEIYEYLKLLYSRIGRTFSPISGVEVKRHQINDVIDFILEQKGLAVYILSPIILPEGRKIEEHLNILLQQGFNRLFIDGKMVRIEDYLKQKNFDDIDKVRIMIDRMKVNDKTSELIPQISDSVQTAFYEGSDSCIILTDNGENREEHYFSSRFEADGITFETPTTHLFSFNNPYGACPRCEGFGSIIGIDPDLVIPDKSLSIYDNAVACWRGEKMSAWRDQLIRTARHFDFPIHKPYYELTQAQKDLLWTGNRYFGGINDFFKEVESQSYKIQYRVMLSRYRGKTVCPDCQGTRLRKEANYVKINGKSITDLCEMPLSKLKTFFDELVLDKTEQEIAERLLKEINNRLSFLIEVGLEYLTLNRTANTLSGGEAQRINLATSLGSCLVSSTYILDEPSIGLHSRDTQRLIKVLKRLRDIGNTVIVVEHDEEIIRNADHIIDIGPYAGVNGGEVVFEGTIEEMIGNNEDRSHRCDVTKSMTAKYISGEKQIPVPSRRRKWNNAIEFIGCCEHNLKNINVKIPLNVLTVVTGVSGSGKSTLINDIIYTSLKKHFEGTSDKVGSFGKIQGSLMAIEGVEYINQNPIERSTRSNPMTYVKAFDDIRQLFIEQKLAKNRGLKPGYFSFNVAGGRCDNCQGSGTLKVEMQFMADIYLKCDVCNGTRYKEEALEIKFKGKNISDILNMSIDEVIDFMESNKECEYKNIIERIIAKMKPLQDVGLGYLQAGQPSATLSGGEAQRIKLASFLINGMSERPTLFIFDEPTTGLHFHDINKLLKAFDALINNGHSLIVIEHDPDVIKVADWIIDLGPEGGDKGGEVIFEGTPEDLIKCERSFTAKVLEKSLRC